MSAKIIKTRSQLTELIEGLSLPPDWRAPDKLDVCVDGKRFDNTGAWPREWNDKRGASLEVHVNVIFYSEDDIFEDGEVVAVVNLADLFAWASSSEKIG